MNLLSWSLRIGVIVGIALIIAAIRRNALPIERRALWTAVIVSAVLLPLLAIMLPLWSLVATRPSPIMVMFMPQPEGKPIALGIWAIGTLLVAAWSIGGFAQRRQWLRRSTAASRTMQQLADECSAQLGVSRPIKVVVSYVATEPATWGALRPVICLPTAALEWNDDDLRRVLLHELAHVAAADAPMRMLAQAVVALHWFNPLVWHALYNLVHEQERAADQAVLDAGEGAADYARTLVEMAHTLPTRSQLLAATFAGPRARFRERVNAILDEGSRRSGRVAIVIPIVAMVLTAALVATWRLSLPASAQDTDWYTTIDEPMPAMAPLPPLPIEPGHVTPEPPPPPPPPPPRW